MRVQLLAFSLLVAGINPTAEAYLPLVENQPLAFMSCPLNKAISTQSSSGRIGSVNVNCVVDGINVVYTLTVPTGCEKGGCGLILDTHGMSMNANQQNAGTKLRQYGWAAKQYGAPTPFIVVQPNLTDLFDREKILDPESVAGRAYYNEIPNLASFVNQMMSLYRVDPKRTHMYGFSRSGYTVNAFYCELGLSNMFASYAIGATDFRCKPNKPLLIIAGDDDKLFPTAINDAETNVVALGQVKKTVIVNDTGYSTPKYVWTLLGLQRQGRHHHVRYQVGNFTLETIRHSGSTLPLLGHCHPSNDAINSWLVCSANMDTGRKIIDFFIQNPHS